jgi:UPF0271 protein
MHLSAEDLHECIVAQVRSLAEVATSAGAPLRHVKPHGALYNMAARDETLAAAVVDAIRSVDPSLAVFGLAGSALVKAAVRMGLHSVSEAFADRAYRADGSLLPRDQPGSVLHDATEVAARAVAMARDGSVVAVDGRRIRVQADTICIHGDTPGAPALARKIRDSLASAGITVAAPHR